MPRGVVAGLGNPGTRYAATRHNIGFLIVECFAASCGAKLGAEDNGIRLARIRQSGGELVLAEPQRFMNRSGPPVAALLAREEVPADALLVVHDDLDLEAGRLQLKRSGGTGGHRGLDSLVDSLGTDVFPRLRVGIGRPPAGTDVVDYVLEPYPASELDGILDTIARGAEALAAWAESGTDSAMNIVNVRRKAP